MVKNWITSAAEKLVFITPDGVKYNFHDPARKAVIATTGWGMPPIELATARGPYQHGANPLDIRLGPRPIDVSVRNQSCNRDDYWESRAELLNVLRPNRTNIDNPSPSKLRWYRSDGTIRQADVFVQAGPTLNKQNEGWDEFAYQDTISFIALNPILYDPQQYILSITAEGCEFSDMLSFPFIFNFGSLVFDTSTCTEEGSTTATYLGNWTEFPLITVFGPARNFTIVHDQTQQKIALTVDEYLIPAGDSAVFDLTYGRKTVYLGSDPTVSLLSYISSDSDLGSFALEPDPDVENGINSFTITANDTDSNTAVLIQYFNRYMGI